MQLVEAFNYVILLDETAEFQDDGGLAEEHWIDRVTLLTLQHGQSFLLIVA